MKAVRKPSRSTIETGINGTQVGEVCVEKHYSVSELGKIWNLSTNTIRRMFENEPGVLKLGAKEGRFRRRYTTLRIPERIAVRVQRQLQAAG